MSFFDDDPDDEPTRTRPARPRRAAVGGHTGPADPDVIRRRRLILFAIGAVVLIVLILMVKSCADNSRRNALTSYNTSVTEIAADSDQRVSKELFTLLSGGAGGADAVTRANQIRQRADDDVARARKLDVPDEMADAQRNLELVLNLRDNGVRRIAADLGTSQTQGRAAVAAIKQIAGQMQAFLASDVIYSQRVQPLIQQALDNGGLQGTRASGSQFLPALGWLDFSQAAERINPDAGGAGSTPTGQARPGRHGHGLVATTIGGTTLTPDGDAKVAVAPGMALTVKFANQGDWDEANVKVSAKVEPATGAAYTLTTVVPKTTKGAEATATLPFTHQPANGSTAKITVTIAKVPGEVNLENNTATYNVFFN